VAFGRWGKQIRPVVFGVLVVILVLHTAALIARMYVTQRAPVINLYSSAVFIGWAIVLASLCFELIFRNGIGNLVASIAGGASLMVAYGLDEGDTMGVLQAVLDTQFWLSTHVVTIALGYSSTFLAGLLGIIYLLQVIYRSEGDTKRTRLANDNALRDIHRMTYGVVCFSILFSFVGTVLGGLWADDSWGRFWGWDPKENGALLIVIWNALMLHARWDKMVGERGFAMLAVFGNVVTAWSWFGTNQLGIGLHSYGFTSGVLIGLGVFAVSQLAIIAAAFRLSRE
jgi:cytochrome c-type biogenesis protein CcsB